MHANCLPRLIRNPPRGEIECRKSELVQRMLLRHTRVTQDQQEVKCPSVFTIIPAKSGRLGGTTYEMRLYCEEPGGWHPLAGETGRYKLTESPDWLRTVRL